MSEYFLAGYREEGASMLQSDRKKKDRRDLYIVKVNQHIDTLTWHLRYKHIYLLTWSGFIILIMLKILI